MTILGAPGEILAIVQYNVERMELKNDSDTAILLPMEDTLAPLKCNQIAKLVTTDHVQVIVFEIQEYKDMIIKLVLTKDLIMLHS